MHNDIFDLYSIIIFNDLFIPILTVKFLSISLIDLWFRFYKFIAARNVKSDSLAWLEFLRGGYIGGGFMVKSDKFEEILIRKWGVWEFGGETEKTSTVKGDPLFFIVLWCVPLWDAYYNTGNIASFKRSCWAVEKHVFIKWGHDIFSKFYEGLGVVNFLDFFSKKFEIFSKDLNIFWIFEKSQISIFRMRILEKSQNSQKIYFFKILHYKIVHKIWSKNLFTKKKYWKKFRLSSLCS